MAAGVGEQLEDLVGRRRDDALHGLDVVGHGGTVPGAPRGVPESERDDGAEHLAALHAMERRLDVVEADRLGDEAVEVEAALQVEVDEQREVAAGRQSPYQDGFSAPPRPKKSIIGMSGSPMSGLGTPTCTTVPARSRA